MKLAGDGCWILMADGICACGALRRDGVVDPPEAGRIKV